MLPGAKGYPELIVLTKVHESDSMPVWDAKEVLLTGRPAGWQIAPLVPFYCRNPGELSRGRDWRIPISVCGA